MQTPPAIRFNSIEQVFPATTGAPTHALSGLDFTIGRHEFVSVLGPSGCGKSTLLRLLAGLMLPSAGKVEVFGNPVREPRDDVGIVFQRPTLLPWLSVIDNVTFPIRHKRGRVSKEDRRRGQDMLELVRLGDFADKRVDALSGGMQQRVGIARALLLDPDILLMDEPFSALDALSRDEMSLELLRIWRERPKTVLFITHSIPEALLLSDRIIVLSERPGTVRDEIIVPFARPRSLETMADPRFNEMANSIRRRLFTHPVDQTEGEPA
ncbi:MAG: ABC transporter ATP-binding protein [Confluentimicrobium sp.]|nr:ABC transporter ATP-binding protein [Actibacterium sp.]MBF52779.1 ABC transporter ATP-binding protein [Actibacterium sp.]OWU68549.1 ABC transporter [Roseovarius sp. 22II1-1F6A]|tara:strand:- start:310 stop:1110 length:801 start_codon:yes stop_codon:yes gene_type:complete